jgi:HK97 gp10 family phage protein
MTRVDASQVTAFANRLNAASRRIDEEGDRLEDEWGEKWADEMRAIVPVLTGRLKSSIEQVDSGVIEMEGYGVYVDRGTSEMAPQPFIRPAMNRIKEPASREFGARAVDLITRR